MLNRRKHQTPAAPHIVGAVEWGISPIQLPLAGISPRQRGLPKRVTTPQHPSLVLWIDPKGYMVDGMKVAKKSSKARMDTHPPTNTLLLRHYVLFLFHTLPWILSEKDANNPYKWENMNCPHSRLALLDQIIKASSPQNCYRQAEVREKLTSTEIVSHCKFLWCASKVLCG